MTLPVKPFATIDEQMDIFVARGLVLDRALAAQWLRSVGYYRLSGYWYPYRQLGENPARRRDEFIGGADFQDVARLYEFDRKLRTLIHDGIERVEVALRIHIGNLLGVQGPLAYRNAAAFRSTFDHSAWLVTVGARAARARRHSEAIRHYETKYDGELPIWVLTEVLDFSDISRLYDGLLARDQWTIAERLGVVIDDSALAPNQRAKVRRRHPLARWFEQLTIVRNSCAHHARVWNRSFAPVSTAGLRTIDGLRGLPEGQSERLFGAVTVIGWLLRSASPGSTWATKLRALIDDTFSRISHRTITEMGFPEGW